jgi:Mlc titration factor MtfA (ptsG expression regulator)
MALTIMLAAGGLVLLWLIGEPVLRARRRSRLRREPLSEARRTLLRRLPIYRRLPPDLQRQLRGHLQVFLAEKRFTGCAGLEVTELMRVTIAAQACLLLLNRRADYFPGLREILVYPAAFVVERLQVDAQGLHTDLTRVLAGESSSAGQVVLSWDDASAGAADADDGRNVVIHEFAHQLDQEFGHANGAPLLAGREAYQRWSEVLGDAYARLRHDLARGLPTVLDPYAAQDPAEFFAVACEVFFEQPARMHRAEPALYQQLRSYFGVDPLSWA